MSGGSYNYLYLHITGLEQQRGDIQEMRDRLQGLADRNVPGAAKAAADTQAVLDRLDQAEAQAQALSDVWHAVEWCDSSDWSEDDVHDALAKHQGSETTRG